MPIRAELPNRSENPSSVSGGSLLRVRLSRLSPPSNAQRKSRKNSELETNSMDTVLWLDPHGVSLMPKATFENVDGDDVEIDSDDVVHLAAGEEPEVTVIELENGDQIEVVATELEVAAELGLNPLEYVDAEDDDESIEGMVEDEGLDDEE